MYFMQKKRHKVCLDKVKTRWLFCTHLKCKQSPIKTAELSIYFCTVLLDYFIIFISIIYFSVTVSSDFTMTDAVMGTKGVHVQSGPLGAELTDEEKEIINSVIVRAEKMEAMEQERIG